MLFCTGPILVSLSKEAQIEWGFVCQPTAKDLVIIWVYYKTFLQT